MIVNFEQRDTRRVVRDGKEEEQILLCGESDHLTEFALLINGGNDDGGICGSDVNDGASSLIILLSGIAVAVAVGLILLIVIVSMLVRRKEEVCHHNHTNVMVMQLN